MNTEIENQLKSLHKRASVGVFFFLLLIVCSIITFALFGGYGLICVGVTVIEGIFTFKSYNRLNTLFKDSVVKSTLSEIFDDFVFTPKSGIPEEVVYSTGMMRRGDRYSSNDLITGLYHGVSFMQSDVCIEDETRDSEGNTETTTIFKGRWMIFDFNKEFKSDLQVVSKWFSGSKKKGNIFTKKEDKLNRIKFENEEFNKAFRVFAQSEHEAFYILTPQIMESLMALKEGMKAPIMLMFVGGRLHVAVANYKDAYEVKLFSKFDIENEKARITNDTRVITDFVDKLSLDRDIYKQ